MNGARLIAIHEARYYKDNDGELSLGPGPFVKALEYASDCKAKVLGKPCPDFFSIGLAGVDPSEAIMIGDVSCLYNINLYLEDIFKRVQCWWGSGEGLVENVDLFTAMKLGTEIEYCNLFANTVTILMTTYELQVTYASEQAQGFKFIFYAFMKFRGFIASIAN